MCELELIKCGYENLNNKFTMDVLRSSLMNYEKYVSNKTEWRKVVNEVMKSIDCTATIFPSVVLNVEQMLKLMKILGLFPFTFYARREDIKIISEINDTAYNQTKAYDVIITPLRMDTPFYLPIHIKMRLFYLPYNNKCLKILYTGDGYKRYIESICSECVLNNKLTKRLFVERIKKLQFPFLKCILEGLPIDDSRYVEEWINLIKYNV